MRPLSERMRLPRALLACALLTAPYAAAEGPPIDVELQATFPSPPFLLELLESAAVENSSAYAPLLSTVASGRFHVATTEHELYTSFEKTLKEDGHVTDPASLASWRLSVATRETAPLVEAHYQFWQTVAHSTGSSSPLEVWRAGAQCLSTDCGAVTAVTDSAHHSTQNLQFDRALESQGQSIPYTLYADPTAQDFAPSYTAWVAAHKGQPFRLRYKPSPSHVGKPLPVGGYGVELALKRTDYIVIDDRDADEAPAPSAAAEKLSLEDETAADVKPLSTSELRKLSVNAASFIMANKDPLDTLLKVSQDFPKYSSLIAQHNATSKFLAELRQNRMALLRPGLNALWINGQQIPPREVDIFTLLESTRRERKLIKSIESQGLSTKEAISLLEHPAVAESVTSTDGQRYDYTDAIEGNRAIIWLNDIEKDKRYSDFSDKNDAFLQRLFPGQLPSVKKNAFNVVFALDLTQPKTVAQDLELLQTLVRRLVPVRFGIVPLAADGKTASQLRVMYYLKEAYGLSAMLKYMEQAAEDGDLTKPSKSVFEDVVATSELRKRHVAFSFDKVLEDEAMVRAGWEGAINYAARLALSGPEPPIFVNGMAVPYAENWMQSLSQQVGVDMQVLQQGIFEGDIKEGDNLAEVFLKSASTHRDPLLIPEDTKDIRIINLADFFNNHQSALSTAKPFRISNTVKASKRNSLVVVADFNGHHGAELVANAATFAAQHEDVEVRFVQNAADKIDAKAIKQIQDLINDEHLYGSTEQKEQIGTFLTGSLATQATELPEGEAVAAALGLSSGETGILFNGRSIGPIGASRTLKSSDLDTLYEYETNFRRTPTVTALEDLGIEDQLKGLFAIPKLASTVALSVVSDLPEGIFDTSTGPRTSVFTKWGSDATCVKLGDEDTTSIQLTAVVDPASELAQRWVPLLHTLAGLDGVSLQLFLNPRDTLEELPVKRFYRHVLQAAPEFASDGSIMGPAAHFVGIPENALLTMGLEVPPSWLVSAKESVHDLDNIKLNSLKGAQHLYALYELESILVEGHSRDVTLKNPPRGAQLSLATGNDPDFGGTIVMANLGYIQFKANPGVYTLALKDGASKAIFSLDSAGTMGYDAATGDDNNQVSLHSFKGATIFPRLSRRPGQEKKDVLEYSTSTSVEDLAVQGAGMVDELLAQAGLPSVKAGDFLMKGMQLGQSILGKAGLQAPSSGKRHADINIFSVASGHLYERMLNIMTVSVMRHTNKTVKFWFIEQFLSPSFKTFLPTMAAEYGFEYEMVAFKWPHWLRAQTEKQRIIWGYKILFLDVLFPLDLDKVIFVDADQIVRTDMHSLVTHDLEGAPYGFTPMCDSRTEMEGFRFWKQGYWKNFLRGLPYHISALYVVDLKRFRAIAAGDRLRQQYHALSADPQSLSNLDQDLPNHMQVSGLPIHSLPQEWLWCETWCSDEALADARTIDLCNNPQTKEPKLDRARRQVPEWTVYDDEIAALAKRARGRGDAAVEGVIGGPEAATAAAKSSDKVAQKKDEL